MADAIMYDHRLVGASDIVYAAENRLVVASRIQRKLVTVGPRQSDTSPYGPFEVTGYSTEQVHEPVKLAYDATYIYALGVDVFMRFTNATTPVIQVTVPLACAHPNWLIVNGSYIMAPYSTGGVQVLNTSGVQVGLYYAGIIRASFAAFDGVRYLYVIDDTNGKGFVLDVDGDAMELIAKFNASNCRGIRGGFLDGDDLVIATQHRVITFDVSDPEVPVHDDATVVDADITGIVSLGSGDYWVTTREYYSPQNSAFAIGSTTGVNTDAGLYILHSKTGAISGPEIEPSVVISAGPDQSLPLDTVQLDGSASGPGVGDFTFEWTQIGGPVGATFDDDTILDPEVTLPSHGSFTFRLTATDGDITLTDDVSIVATDIETKDIVTDVLDGTHYVTIPYPVTFTLEEEPATGNTHTVVFEAPAGASIHGEDTFEFTSENWDTEQTVYVICDYPADTMTFPYEVTSIEGSPVNGSFQVVFTDVSAPHFMPYVDLIYVMDMTLVPEFTYIDKV